MSLLLRLTCLGLLLAGSALAAPEPWAQLKIGMSAPEAVALLGEPLNSRQGKGLTTLTYDEGGELLVFRGRFVAGWTAPASAHLAARSVDIWSRHPAGKYYPTLYSLLQAELGVPLPAAAVKREAVPGPTRPTVGYEEYARGAKG